MRFLASLGAKARLAPLQGNDSVRRTTGLAPYAYGLPYAARTRSGAMHVENFIEDTYGRITWVFKAVNTVANNAASLKVVCRKGDPVDGPEIEHPLLSLLNWRSSPWTREQAFIFRHRVSAQLSLSTRGAFIEVVRNNGGEPMALHLLPPQKVLPVPDPMTFVKEYIVDVGYGEWQHLDPRNVVWLRNPHPIDPYRSMTPAEASGLAIDTDWLAAIYNANFLRNDGRPGGLVGIKGQLDDDDAQDVKSFFRGGVAQAGTWRVVEADGIDVADLAANPRDMQYIEGRHASKVEILDAYGVPESMIGNASERTFANADAEERMFWTQTEPPHLEVTAGGYDLIDDDPNTFIVHDTSSVEVLQAIENKRHAELREDFDRGLITVDEYRKDTGRKPFKQPESEVPYIGMSLVPLFTDQNASPSAGAVTTPPVPSGGDPTLTVPAPPQLRVASKGRDNPFVSRSADLNDDG